MNKRMTEQELLANFPKALRDGHIYVCYQPKINHSTGRMIGAEALMRWWDPEYGMQYPSDFIPVLELNGLINRADLAIFEQVCKFQRRCLDEKIPTVPISVNMSRYDIFQHNYIDEIEVVRRRYDIPVKLLHVEITESSAIGGMELVSDVLSKLHAIGYVVEMDDFGSGYSSLNVLKDLEVDVIKLDMRFLSGSIGGRGGTIISAMVQMTKWLGTPVVAEGVETLEQADYMKSIGCSYIQGYLYSKPVSAEDFIKKLQQIELEPMAEPMDLLVHMDAGKFWDPNSMETLIFNNYVGGAVIFSFQNCRMEILRVNEKYTKELGMNLTEKEILRTNPCDMLDEENKRIYQETIQRAIETGEEQTCETWRCICSKTCGEDKICIRSFIRVIGKAGDQYLFYAMVQNITAEKKRFIALYDNERMFRFAVDQINAFAWEYEFSTRKMRPCSRCMRELNLPPVIENYPEPLFESGLFPPDCHDMYTDMLRQLEEGAKEIEAVIPLTPDRIPFHVRYTTEFDENDRPLKAYGSAAIVVDEKA